MKKTKIDTEHAWCAASGSGYFLPFLARRLRKECRLAALEWIGNEKAWRRLCRLGYRIVKVEIRHEPPQRKARK